MRKLIFAPKEASEVVSLSAPFGAELAQGETISTAAVAVTVHSGEDLLNLLIPAGAAVITGSLVSQSFSGGLLGVIYTIKFTITTSLSNVYSAIGAMAIVPVQP